MKDEKSTYGSDIYSLSMVIVEVCLFLNSTMHRCSNLFRFQLVTGRIPFYGHNNLLVPYLVVTGVRPPKPVVIVAPGMTPQVWDIAERCWHREAQSRPDAKVVLQELEDMKAKTGVCTPEVPVATRVD